MYFSGQFATTMRNILVLILMLFLASSCQLFNTEKIPSETFYEKEVEAIDWSEVDQYPVFTECERFSEKPAQKTCFENALANALYNNMVGEDMLAGEELIDTLWIEIWVSKQGELTIKNLEIDSIIQKDFPQLTTRIVQSIDSLDVIAPAYKRGIPVTTQFKLPVVIKTE